MARELTGRDKNKYVVRFPDDLRDRVAALAKANGRSMNAEIVFALEAWTSGSSDLHLEEVAARILKAVTRQIGAGSLGNLDDPRDAN